MWVPVPRWGGPFFAGIYAIPVFGSQAKEKRQYFRRPFGLTCLAKLTKILRDGKSASLIHFSVCRKATGLKSGVSSGVSWVFYFLRRSARCCLGRCFLKPHEYRRFSRFCVLVRGPTKSPRGHYE